MAKLITESSYQVELYEDTKKNELYVVGVFSSAEVKNNNGRRYKRELLEREISKINKTKIKSRNCFGELGHPPSPETNLEKVAILTTELDWKGNDVVGKAKVLDTPNGSIAKTLIKEGSVGISSRGLGTVSDDGYVNEDFNLLCWDLVSDASNPASKFVNGIYEGQEFSVPGEKKPSYYESEDFKMLFEKQLKNDSNFKIKRLDEFLKLSDPEKDNMIKSLFIIKDLERIGRTL